RLIPGVPGRAPIAALAVRPRAARHPRELGAHAGNRRCEPRPHSQDLYDFRRDRRHGGRGIGADHFDRIAGDTELRALGRRAGHAGARRRRTTVWRPGRLHYLPRRARSVLRDRPAILVRRHRRASDHRRPALAERYSWRPLRPVGAMEAEMSALADTVALSTRGLGKKFGSLVVARDIE